MAEIKSSSYIVLGNFIQQIFLKDQFEQIHEEEKSTANIIYLLFIFSINVIKKK